MGLITNVIHLNEEGRPSSRVCSNRCRPTSAGPGGAARKLSTSRAATQVEYKNLTRKTARGCVSLQTRRIRGRFYLDPISTTSKFGTFTRASILTAALCTGQIPERPSIVTKGRKLLAKPLPYRKKLCKPIVVHWDISRVQVRLKNGGVVVVCA